MSKKMFYAASLSLFLFLNMMTVSFASEPFHRPPSPPNTHSPPPKSPAVQQQLQRQLQQNLHFKNAQEAREKQEAAAAEAAKEEAAAEEEETTTTKKMATPQEAAPVIYASKKELEAEYKAEMNKLQQEHMDASQKINEQFSAKKKQSTSIAETRKIQSQEQQALEGPYYQWRAQEAALKAEFDANIQALKNGKPIAISKTSPQPAATPTTNKPPVKTTAKTPAKSPVVTNNSPSVNVNRGTGKEDHPHPVVNPNTPTTPPKQPTISQAEFDRRTRDQIERLRREQPDLDVDRIIELINDPNTPLALPPQVEPTPTDPSIPTLSEASDLTDSEERYQQQWRDNLEHRPVALEEYEDWQDTALIAEDERIHQDIQEFFEEIKKHPEKKEELRETIRILSNRREEIVTIRNSEAERLGDNIDFVERWREPVVDGAKIVVIFVACVGSNGSLCAPVIATAYATEPFEFAGDVINHTLNNQNAKREAGKLEGENDTWEELAKSTGYGIMLESAEKVAEKLGGEALGKLGSKFADKIGKQAAARIIDTASKNASERLARRATTKAQGRLLDRASQSFVTSYGAKNAGKQLTDTTGKILTKIGATGGREALNETVKYVFGEDKKTSSQDSGLVIREGEWIGAQGKQK